MTRGRGELLPGWRVRLRGLEENAAADQVRGDELSARSYWGRAAELRDCIEALEREVRDAAQAQAGRGQVRHRRTGNLYTIVGRSKHKVLGERWVDTILYRNAAGEVFSRELDNFEASFERSPALAQAQAGAGEGQGEGA